MPNGAGLSAACVVYRNRSFVLPSPYEWPPRIDETLVVGFPALPVFTISSEPHLVPCSIVAFNLVNRVEPYFFMRSCYLPLVPLLKAGVKYSLLARASYCSYVPIQLPFAPEVLCPKLASTILVSFTGFVRRASHWLHHHRLVILPSRLVGLIFLA